MSTDAAMGAASTLVALAFALSTWERWLVRGRRHDIAWAIALALFAAGAASLWAGATLGWSSWSFRAFYLFGAILNVPALALGSVYLLWGQKVGDRTAIVLALSGAFAAGVLVSTPLLAPLDPDRLHQGKEVFGLLPRIMAAFASAGGATVVLGGTLWSIWRLARGRDRGAAGSLPASAAKRIVSANTLIALGVLVLSGGGLLNSVVNEMTAFSISLLVGVALLFGGFLVAGSTAGTDSKPRSLPDGVVGDALHAVWLNEVRAAAPSPSHLVGAHQRT